MLLELRDIEKGLRHRTRIGDAGRLDEQVVEAAALDQILHAFHEILADGAAEAAVADLDDLLLRILHELAIDPDLPISFTITANCSRAAA
jgi:hypothetical protein